MLQCASADKEHAEGRKRARDDLVGLLMLMHCPISGRGQGGDQKERHKSTSA